MDYFVWQCDVRHVEPDVSGDNPFDVLDETDAYHDWQAELVDSFRKETIAFRALQSACKSFSSKMRTLGIPIDVEASGGRILWGYAGDWMTEVELDWLERDFVAACDSAGLEYWRTDYNGWCVTSFVVIRNFDTAAKRFGALL